MKKNYALRLIALTLTLLAVVGLSVPSAAVAHRPRTILYFTRHAENQTKLNPTGVGTFAEDCLSDRSCCTIILNPLGVARRDALADWFVEQRLARTLTDLIGTNKPRTVQTLQALADATGLPIQQYPNTSECDSCCKTTQGSKEAVIVAIQGLRLGSRAVIANHSDTLYEIMRVSVNLDTSDDTHFPKEVNSQGQKTDRVDGFDNLWVVEVNRSGQGSLLRHITFDFKLDGGKLRGLGRTRGVGDGDEIHDREN